MPKFEGVNELTLNHATMRKAIAFYLNEEVFYSGAAIRVTDIAYNSSSMTFDIKFEAAPEPEIEDPTR